MISAIQFAQDHKQRFITELKELLRIPSISTLPKHKNAILQAAQWLTIELQRIGLTKVETFETAGHPIVYAQWLGAGETAPTVLIYGHYDVQPAVQTDGWDQDPFEPIERDNQIIARGSSDDKGQIFAHIKAIESVLTQGVAPVNIKLLLEGEEEIGSPNLNQFIRENRDLITANVCVISDGSMPTPEQPTISYATRGLACFELEVTGPSQDLHSGSYGGAVHNPAQALTEILAQLHHPNGQVNIPGFYDDVLPLTPEERNILRQSAQDSYAWQSATGVPKLWGEADYAVHERVGARPTLEINGLSSGFYGPGIKTVLPAKALAKISCRLVSNQTPKRIFTLIQEQIQRITPDTVRSEIRWLGEAHPALMERDSPFMQAAIRAYKQGWGCAPLFQRMGGTLPVVAELQQQLDNLPVIMMNFGLDSDGAHGPNEHFSIEMFHKGVQTAIQFLYALS